METFSDDDFEKVSEMDLSDSDVDYEREPINHETPSSTPPSVRRMRASDCKTIPCTYDGCSKTFNRNARLEQHLLSHTNTRLFRCHHAGCGKDYLRETHLRHHIKSAHSTIRDYVCTWQGCDKSFATGTRLRRHLQAHEGREKYRCRGYENCDQTFRKHDTLRRHILQVHEQIRPFPCMERDVKSGRQCDKAFDTAERLRVHQRSKHDHARFSCAECLRHNNVKTNSVSNLTRQFHAFFTTYSELQAHMSECHPPTCPHCPTSFTTAKELTRHLELQHGIFDPSKPQASSFRCLFPGCDRSFTKRGNLNVHIRSVHEKQKDFICGETEIELPADVHTGNPVEVHGCGRAFTAKASLEDHVRTAHLGMTSLQVERRNKRKAERRDENEDAHDFEPRTRKPRKDKGIKKTSILQQLTGAPVAVESNIESVLDPALHAPSSLLHLSSIQAPSLQLKLKAGRGKISDDVADDDEDDGDGDGDDDDLNQLSGSMTLLDDRLYHYGEQFEFASLGCSQGMVPPALPITKPALPKFAAAAGYSRIKSESASSLEDEPFFHDFEHEPELLDSGTQLVRPKMFMTK